MDTPLADSLGKIGSKALAPRVGKLDPPVESIDLAVAYRDELSLPKLFRGCFDRSHRSARPVGEDVYRRGDRL
jgi:hypothetical protein